MSSSFERLNRVMAKSLGVTPQQLVDSFAPAAIADIDEICELRRSGFGDHLRNDRERMLWRYFSRNDRSDMFVLRLQEKIIAAVGLEPVILRANDIEYQGVCCADIVVSPEMMSRGLGAWMNLNIQNTYSVVSAMGSNNNSDSMIRKLFTPLNVRSHLKFPIRSFAYLAGKGVSPRLANMLRTPVDVGLFLRRKYYAAKCYASKFYAVLSRRNSYRVQRLDSFALISEFLAKDVSYRHTNTFVRSPDFIHWRFEKNPVSQFLPIGLFLHDELVGFAILKRGKSIHSCDDWFLMDWQLHRDHYNDKNLQYLFGRCVNIAAARGACFLNMLLSDAVSRMAAIQAGFSFRDTEDGFFLWANDAVSPKIFDLNGWFLTYADTDEVT